MAAGRIPMRQGHQEEKLSDSASSDVPTQSASDRNHSVPERKNNSENPDIKCSFVSADCEMSDCAQRDHSCNSDAQRLSSDINNDNKKGNVGKSDSLDKGIETINLSEQTQSSSTKERTHADELLKNSVEMETVDDTVSENNRLETVLLEKKDTSDIFGDNAGTSPNKDNIQNQTHTKDELINPLTDDGNKNVRLTSSLTQGDSTMSINTGRGSSESSKSSVSNKNMSKSEEINHEHMAALIPGYIPHPTGDPDVVCSPTTDNSHAQSYPIISSTISDNPDHLRSSRADILEPGSELSGETSRDLNTTSDSSSGSNLPHTDTDSLYQQLATSQASALTPMGMTSLSPGYQELPSMGMTSLSPGYQELPSIVDVSRRHKRYICYLSSLSELPDHLPSEHIDDDVFSDSQTTHQITDSSDSKSQTNTSSGASASGSSGSANQSIRRVEGEREGRSRRRSHPLHNLGWEEEDVKRKEGEGGERGSTLELDLAQRMLLRKKVIDSLMPKESGSS